MKCSRCRQWLMREKVKARFFFFFNICSEARAECHKSVVLSRARLRHTCAPRRVNTSQGGREWNDRVRKQTACRTPRPEGLDELPCEVSAKVIWEDEPIVWRQVPRQAEIVALATAENNRSQIRFSERRAGQGFHPSIVTRITHSWKLLWIAELWVISLIPTPPPPTTGNLCWWEKR